MEILVELGGRRDCESLNVKIGYDLTVEETTHLSAGYP